MSLPERVGVVLMSYGTPATPADVEGYYLHIRRGRPPTEAQLADLQARYNAIGGISPLAERTRAQGRAVQAALEQRAPGRFHLELGAKHAAPFVEDAVAALGARGCRHVVALVLAPHYSAASVGEYMARATAAAGPAGVALAGIPSWHLEPAYLAFLAGAVRDGLAGLPDGATVLFTAHSLPERTVAEDTTYPDQLAATAAAVAAEVGLDRDRWGLGWQSAGRTPEPWLGPDVTVALAELAERGAPGVLVCPAGFVADHLEVLYDLDVEAAGVAARLGLPFARTASLNDDPAVADALAARVVELAEATWGDR